MTQDSVLLNLRFERKKRLIIASISCAKLASSNITRNIHPVFWQPIYRALAMKLRFQNTDIAFIHGIELHSHHSFFKTLYTEG